MASKKSLSFEQKLAGSLALLNQTATPNKATGKTLMAERHGEHLANLVARGNQDAIKLVGLLDQRTVYEGRRNPDFKILASYGRSIDTLSRNLGLDNGAGDDLADLIETALSGNGFNSKEQLQRNLSEGLLLNINQLASKALSVPSGEYVVWLTNANQTVLVPTNQVVGSDQVLEQTTDNYELYTRDLLTNWNKLQRVVSEVKAKQKSAARGALAGAVDNSGMSQEELAAKAGVDPSTVSRWLNRGENPGSWRNPRLDNLQSLATNLRVDPSAFLHTGPAASSQEKTEEGEEEVR